MTSKSSLAKLAMQAKGSEQMRDWRYKTRLQVDSKLYDARRRIDLHIVECRNAHSKASYDAALASLLKAANDYNIWLKVWKGLGGK